MPTLFWQDAIRYGRIVRLLNHDSQCIKVMENDQFRWLEIDGITQSLMQLNDPANPVLPPHQAMVEAFPADEGQGVALELGLGGGAMQRYFQRYRPHWQLTSVELNPLIVTLFEDHFMTPGHPANRCQQGDAREVVASLASHSIEALLIDICTNEGLPDFLSEPEFWQQISRILHPQAMLAVNLIPSHDAEWQQVTQLMQEILAMPLGWIEVPGHLNMVVVRIAED